MRLNPMISRWCLIVPLTVAMVLLLCGNVFAEKEVTIRGLVVDSYARAWQERQVPEFNKKYPHIKVVLDPCPYADMDAKLMLELTRKPIIYDFVLPDEPWIPRLADAGLLEPLKETFKDITDSDYDWDDIHPGPLAAGEWKGVVYGVPVRSNLLLMFFNRAVFRKAGVEVPDYGISWADFEKKAAALIKDTDGDGKPDQWGFDTYFGRNILTPPFWQAIMNSNGGKLFDENLKPVFNDPIGVAALETHIRLTKYGPPGCESHKFRETLEAFRQGKIGMMWQWGSIFRAIAVDQKMTTVKLGDGGVMTLPQGTLAQGCHRGVWVASVPKGSPNKEAAWKYVQWVSSKEGEKWSAANVGSFPARISTITSEPPEPWLGDVYKAILAGYDAIAKGNMCRPRLPHYKGVQRILELHHNRAMIKEVSAKEALDDAAKEIEKFLKRKGYYK